MHPREYDIDCGLEAASWQKFGECQQACRIFDNAYFDNVGACYFGNDGACYYESEMSDAKDGRNAIKKDVLRCFPHKRRVQTLDDLEIKCELVQIQDITEDSISTVQVDNNERFLCPWPDCKSTFKKIYNLKSHYKIHLGIKPYECPECIQRFARSHDLTRHRRSHQGIKLHECEICRKRFTRSDAVDRHKEKAHGFQKKLDTINIF